MHAGFAVRALALALTLPRAGVYALQASTPASLMGGARSPAAMSSPVCWTSATRTSAAAGAKTKALQSGAVPPLLGAPATDGEAGRQLRRRESKRGRSRVKGSRAERLPRGRASRVLGEASPLAPAASAANATALYTRANRLLQTHQIVDAIGVFEQLALLTPDDGRVWVKLMSAYKRARKPARAEATIHRAIAACPRNARLRQALADLCRGRRAYVEARTHFRAAMELEPTLASVYDSWGRMEASLGEAATAAALYEKGLEIAPSARLCHALGVLLDTRGAAAPARAVLRRGLSLPNEEANPQLLHALGMLEVRAGNHADARSNFQAAIREHPHFTMGYLSLGQVRPARSSSVRRRRGGMEAGHASGGWQGGGGGGGTSEEMPRRERCPNSIRWMGAMSSAAASHGLRCG